jgi:hypothetical protein
VQYIIYREYLHRHPRVTALSPDDRQYQAYVERRLRQLYPARGYAGMMGEAVADVHRFERLWAGYRHQVETVAVATVPTTCYAALEPDPSCTGDGDGGGGGYGGTGGEATPNADVDPSWTGNDEHPGYPDGYIPTVQQEIDSLAAEPEEVERILYYESLADGSYNVAEAPLSTGAMVGGARPTIDDLIRAAGEGAGPGTGSVGTQNVAAGLVAGAVALGLAGYFYWRIEQSESRAKSRQALFYPTLFPQDTRADAFRHTFVNVLLRRYCTEPVAHMVMNWWESHSPNTPGGATMDFRNNDLGREVKYSHFRGHWLWDRWDWKEWSRRVRDYVNDPTKGEYIPEWAGSPGPSMSEVQARAQLVPKWKYIFISMQTI